MEIGERVATWGLASELEIECPFKDEQAVENAEEPESIAVDDLATDEQVNKGGTLGENLGLGLQGKKGTTEGPCPPPENPPLTPRFDTPRREVKVFVPGADGVEDQEFPFIVAAHHLIPGNASLGESRLKKLMTKGSGVRIGGKVRKIKNHIGYNVNGAHNGVWLPGNYAIRPKKSSLKKTWSELTDKPQWCMNYVAAVSAKAGGQFHDTHEQYSEAVEKLLTKIYDAVTVHECPLCEEKTEVPPPLPPPYVIKERLYALSNYLRSQLQGTPGVWRRPWFASDRWREAVFSGRDQWEAFDRIFRIAKRH